MPRRTQEESGDTAEAPPAQPQNLGRFLGYARPYRWLITMVVLLGVTRYALQFVTPWGVGVLLDGALKDAGTAPGGRDARLHQLHWIGALMTLALVVRCCLQYGESILTSRVGNRLVFDLRRQLYVHIHHLSQSFFDSRQVGSIGSRVLNDISVAQNLIGSGVVSVVIDAVALAFTLAVLFRLEWRLTLVAALIMPGYVASLRRLTRASGRSARRSRTSSRSSPAPSTKPWPVCRSSRRSRGSGRASDSSSTSRGATTSAS
jgi:ABC-type multidrug transport system fused ATPase/permease subunit